MAVSKLERESWEHKWLRSWRCWWFARRFNVIFKWKRTVKISLKFLTHSDYWMIQIAFRALQLELSLWLTRKAQGSIPGRIRRWFMTTLSRYLYYVDIWRLLTWPIFLLIRYCKMTNFWWFYGSFNNQLTFMYRELKGEKGWNYTTNQSILLQNVKRLLQLQLTTAINHHKNFKLFQ